ncbi:trans-aconitate 2-methyltransferase [Streptomyces sp. ST2-7A]|uniref:class I SAM-dependent methyltransferase n=1 Tax=Streptomyces sp. ST2-7A TaxID=2907214 RepID=UPI001F1CF5C1|nr:class I SAM-dependent methyltransferase [Streptomyces sp. ST2-7A]MCE7082763.1 class I SAM-dependent methyltransferase [Streptomyces sp. ST2-7A]
MVDWQEWQRGWDRQQEWYMPDREERFRAMLDTVEALVGDRPRVLDLACGTGSITARVLKRFPGATTVGVDLDPALLTIARGTFEGEERTTFVTADLRDAGWVDRALAAGAGGPFDAVLTATALHWMRTADLRTLYERLAGGVVRPGGVFLNADHMPDPATPRINEAVHALDRARRDREKAAGTQDWADWWAEVARDPELADAAARRFEIFGDPREGDHSDGEVQAPGEHTAILLGAGFAEARAVWASPSDAMVLGLR